MSKIVAFRAYQSAHYERLAAESEANNAHSAAMWTGDRAPALAAIARAEAAHAWELELYEVFCDVPDDPVSSSPDYSTMSAGDMYRDTCGGEC